MVDFPRGELPPPPLPSNKRMKQIDWNVVVLPASSAGASGSSGSPSFAGTF